MNEKCAWFITLDQKTAFAQTAANQLNTYGLPIKGQLWPVSETAGWLVSAQEAAQANAAVVVVIGTTAQYNHTSIRRALAMFRLSLQTRLKRPVNGFVLLSDGPTAPNHQAEESHRHAGVLDDWIIANGLPWQAKAVARAHAPSLSTLPVRLGVHAHERLGVWMETHPCPQQTALGSVVGVSGNQATISFHAAGAAGNLPERTVNEYELQGLKFDAGGYSFNAWAVQNELSPQHSYYVRVDGEPDLIAIGTLPHGEINDVTLVRVG